MALVENLKDISPSLFKKAIELTKQNGILGSSGTTAILFKKIDYDISRPSQVSVRLYNSDVELLITNANGEFIFYGRYNYKLGVDFIANEYFKIFKKIGRTNILGAAILKKRVKEI